MSESRSERAVDFLGRRRGDDQSRSLTGRNVEREAIAARDAACRVDQHGFESSAGAPGHLTRSDPAS